MDEAGPEKKNPTNLGQLDPHRCSTLVSNLLPNPVSRLENS